MYLQRSLSQASQSKTSRVGGQWEGVRSHLSGDFFSSSPQNLLSPSSPPRPSARQPLWATARPPQTAEIPRKGEEEKVGTALWGPKRSPSGQGAPMRSRKEAGAHRRPDPSTPGASGRGDTGGLRTGPAPPALTCGRRLAGRRCRGRAQAGHSVPLPTGRQGPSARHTRSPRPGPGRGPRTRRPGPVR